MVQTLELTLSELLERFNAGQIPTNATVQMTFDDTALQSGEGSPGPLLNLLEQWDREDAQMTPEQQAENERIYNEIERNGIPRVWI